MTIGGTRELREVLSTDFGIETTAGSTDWDMEAVTSLVKEVVVASSGTLTAAQCKGTCLSNYGQAAANTQTLPAAAAGLNGIVSIATSGAGDFHLKAGASDKIYLDGVALDNADKVTLSSPAVGDFFTFASFKSGESSYDWIVRTGQGTLIDGGS